MAVLHLRREMQLAPAADDAQPDAAASSKARAPSLPSRPAPAVSGDAARRRPGRVGRFLAGAALCAIAAGYPAATVAASGVGETLTYPIDRTLWAAPWAGVTSSLLASHDQELGWAADAPVWSPHARLTGKPAYQAALVRSFGQFATLSAAQRARAGAADADLEAVSRLLTSASGAAQVRAARDALANFDRNERKRLAGEGTAPADVAAQVQLIAGWAADARVEIDRASANAGAGPFDRDATIAVFAARGRAQAAHALIESLAWPNSVSVAAARERAVATWREVLTFRPPIVLNGAPDGLFGGGHPAALAFLLSEAEAATRAYSRELLGVARGAGSPGGLNLGETAGGLVEPA